MRSPLPEDWCRDCQKEGDACTCELTRAELDWLLQAYTVWPVSEVDALAEHLHPSKK